MPDLLLELLSEEIPARMQPKAAADLRRLVTDGLVERGLTYAHAEAFVTPRRLALAVTGLAERSPARRDERKGPRVDAPAAALAGFLRATGLAREALEIRDDKKAQVYVAVTMLPGRAAAEIVAETVEAVVWAFPWPKSMRWGSGSLRWIRPLESILCLLSSEAGATVVPLEIDGLAASDTTRGHRFLAPGRFAVGGFEAYEQRLARAHVVLDPAARADRIRHDATQLAFARGLELVADPDLVAEIAGLVEWPVVLAGGIEERFLGLPPEVLRTSMRTHQKFLALRAPATGAITGYVVVANRPTADDGATILAGNARVLAARLSDAAFFWENDLRTPLDAMAAKLAGVTFHARLGSQADRIARIAALARAIAPAVGADPALAERAARLAKADLASQMVYEFPELQGTMGRYYAERAGEPSEVAAAAPAHYAPLGPSDAVPTAPVSVAVGLADKLDLLTGFWAIDEKPTGSKDPFALRRAALGIIRMILDSAHRIRLLPSVSRHFGILEQQLDLVGKRAAAKGGDLPVAGGVLAPVPAGPHIAADLLAFVHDRLKVHLRDQGVRHDVIDAALALPGNDDLVLLVARVRALQGLLGTEDGANLLAGYRRAVSILSQEEKKDGVEYSLDPLPGLAETEGERGLFAALDAAEAALGPALAAEYFPNAMRALAALRAPIDVFFDTTVVNVPNATVRRNRLCLMNRIRVVMNQVADFAAIAGG